MGEKTLLESFIRLTVEILNYILEISSTENNNIANELMNQTKSSSSSSSSSSIVVDNPNTITYDLQEFRNYYALYYLSDDGSLTNNEEIFKDEEISLVTSIWPKKYDMKLILLHYEYYFHQKYSQLSSVSTSFENNPGLFSTASSTVSTGFASVATNNSRIKHQYYIWNNKYQIYYHICVLYVLQLRFYCGLRGLKPSQLLGFNVLDLINDNYYYDDYVNQNIDWKKVRNIFYVSCFVLTSSFLFSLLSFCFTFAPLVLFSFSFFLSLPFSPFCPLLPSSFFIDENESFL
jgi:hypothetical protein